MMQWLRFPGTLGQKVSVLLVVGFGLLLANVVASAWLSSKSGEFADLTLSEQRLKSSVLELFSAAQDAELGQRGFLITGDDVYLQPYTDAVRNVPKLVERLRDLAGDDALVRSKAEQIGELAKQRIDVAQRTVDMARAGNRDGAIDLVRSGAGKKLMDQIRSAIGELQEHQEQQIQNSVAELRASSAWSDWTNFGSLVLITLLAAATALLVKRYVDELEAARSELTVLNEGLENVLEERTGEILRANEEIQQFAYIVSHDLRAPLVNIMGFTSELEAIGGAIKRQLEVLGEKAPEHVLEESRLALETELPEAISFIRASTAKMDRLINAILKLSREGRRVLTPARVNMGELAKGIADSLKHQTEEAGAKIVVRDLPDLVTDRLAIEQVLGNVVENAVKYLEQSRPGEIVIAGRQEGPINEYRVADNGRGIDEADRERVFELFRRAGRQDTKGEGIGLAFVRAIVRRLGGSLTLESELGAGTTVKLRLPRVLAQPGSKKI